MGKPKPKSPGPDAVRAAESLTQIAIRTGARDEPLDLCFCGRYSAKLGVWQEHDEWDKPISGPESYVYIGTDHPDCVRRMEAHPRLYAEVSGGPGSFPICRGCAHRKPGLECGHPELKKNGGAGLNVTLDAFGLGNVILCGRGGRVRPLHRAISCVGRVES